MKIQILWMAVLTVAASGLIPAAAAWAQEKDEVPARATWRPQAPERPELPPGVKPQEEAFKVERPKADLPGLEPDEEDAPEASKRAPENAEVTTPTAVQPVHEGAAETAVEPGASAGPAPESNAEPAEPPPRAATAAPAEPLRESRVSRQEKPATVQASTPAAQREAPRPVPGSVVQPEYPRDALLSGEEGYVTLEFTVTRQGDVANVAITEARPSGVFEETVRRAIRRWEFRPATENGEPVDQRVRHRFEFNLDE